MADTENPGQEARDAAEELRRFSAETTEQAEFIVALGREVAELIAERVNAKGYGQMTVPVAAGVTMEAFALIVSSGAKETMPLPVYLKRVADMTRTGAELAVQHFLLGNMLQQAKMRLGETEDQANG